MLAALVFAAAAAGAADVHSWDVFEVRMEARSAPANAYVDSLPEGGDPLVRVLFTGPGGKQYTVGGFWDGGSTWLARFAPPAAGDWSYASTSSDPGLDNARGTFHTTDWSEAERTQNPARRGFLRAAGHHFEYADGTPFLWIGDTWWNWAKKGILFSRFQHLADDRAEKGFTIGQIMLPGAGGLLDRTASKPDLDQIRQVERMIAYANSRGITVWIHAWWSGKNLARYKPEQIRRWWRYVVHRMGAYNVIWTLAGEYNMDDYGGQGLQFWKDLGAMIRREDPHARLIGAHPTPPGWAGGAAAPQWSTGEVLHNEPWLDYNQSQVGHGKWRNEMIPEVMAADYARTPAKPTVVTEPWYEFDEGNPPVEEIRYGAWAAMLSGAAGHTYGGGHVWWAHTPETPKGPDPWPLHKEFDTDTLDYPGARAVSFMAKFLRGIDWWKLEPHPELVSGNPSRFCTAAPGREYLVYARWGGWLQLDLGAAAPSDAFEFRWYDLAQSKASTGGQVMGGARREFRTPEDYPRFPKAKDWLLHVRRRAGS